MDDLLKKMLLIDQEAEQITAKAQADAAALLDDIRKQLADKREKATADLNARCEKRLTEAKAEIQALLSAEKAKAQQAFAEEQKTFAQQISGKQEQLLQVLLFPGD